LLASISASVGSVPKPAGLANAQGILSVGYLKDATDPTWKDDPASSNGPASWTGITRKGTRPAPSRFMPT
jgi:hypothetical protein